LRNRAPILAVLKAELPTAGTVLEIASGTGEHAAHFARNLPHLRWQPSDIDAANRASIQAHAADAGVANLPPPIALDVRAAEWPQKRAAAIFCANMIHIAPWETALGLFAGARRVLPKGGPLILYGPFFADGETPAPSNVAFDEDLRARNPAWGVRKIEDLIAAAAGFDTPKRIAMPAENLCLVFRRNGF
jgi:SAM-dependent methyltransferase